MSLRPPRRIFLRRKRRRAGVTVPLVAVLGVLSFGLMAAQSATEEGVAETEQVTVQPAAPRRAVAPNLPNLASLEQTPGRPCPVNGGVGPLQVVAACQIRQINGAVINP